MHKSQIITEGENVSDKMNENEKKPLEETACSEAPEKVDEPMPETEETSEKMDKKDKKAVKLLEKQLEDSQKEYEKLLKEKNTLNDTYLRMLAEYDNFRKRVQKEKESLYADGIAEAVEKLLPVLDNLERAASAEATDVGAVLDGVKKVLSQAEEIFTKLGVSEIPAKGEKFNPELHNAVMHEENEDFDENTVSDVFMKGYKLGDKVIRHSVVKVMN